MLILNLWCKVKKWLCTPRLYVSLFINSKLWLCSPGLIIPTPAPRPWWWASSGPSLWLPGNGRIWSRRRPGAPPRWAMVLMTHFRSFSAAAAQSPGRAAQIFQVLQHQGVVKLLPKSWRQRLGHEVICPIRFITIIISSWRSRAQAVKPTFYFTITRQSLFMMYRSRLTLCSVLSSNLAKIC